MNRTVPFVLTVLGFALLAACATTPAPAQPAKDEGKEDAAAPAAAPPDAEAWRTTRPGAGTAPTLRLPVFQKATLKNSLTLYVSEQPELPVVTLAVAMRAGSAADPTGKAGLADLTYGLMLEGAGKYDALQLADAFGNLGVSPGKGTDKDGAQLGVTVLRRNADPALALLAEVVQRPRFAKGDFERKKKQQLADLADQLGNPRFLQRWALSAAAFGESHPYGHLASGIPSTIDAISLADVKSFYAKNVGPAGAALVVTGQVTLAEATAWAEKHLGSWKSKATAPPAPAAPALEARTSVVLVPKAGLNQTVIAAARPGIRATEADYGPLLLADAIYGGNFASRLNLNLREDKAYTYGAFSAVQAMRTGGLIFAGSSVRADVTGASLKEIFAELDGLKKRPITSEEMEAAREGYVRSLPGAFETTSRVADAAAGLYWRDEPLDQYEKLVAAVTGADLAKVQAAAEKYYDQALLKLVLVGDPEVVEAQVPPLGLGEVISKPAPQAPEPPVAKGKK